MIPLRIEEKIERVTESGCWIWLGACQPTGYSVVRFNGKAARAHRVIYKIVFGSIPEGFELDHLCRVRCCVNPHHMEPVTHTENLRRGETIGAKNRMKTHCSNRHELTAENIWIDGKGRRRCRQCNRDNVRQWKRKHSF